MIAMRTLRIGLSVLALAPLLAGCVVAQVTGAAVNTTGAVVGATARTTGKAVGAVIPDGDDGEDRSDRSSRSGERAPYASGSGGYTRSNAEADAHRR